MFPISTFNFYLLPVSSPESFLHHSGLAPLDWNEVLQRIECQLTPLETQTFRRLHGALAAYPTPHTVRSFYDFAAQRELLPVLASFRFERLVDLCAALLKLNGTEGNAGAFFAGKRILDYGAGGGYLADFLRTLGADVTVTDFSPATVRSLASKGFSTLPAAAPEVSGLRFDLILCADSLGEVHADEDDWLSAPEHLDDPLYPAELEARYGFAEKLASLRPLLAPGGTVLVFEPIPLPHFWLGAARALEAAGWTAEVLGPPASGLKLEGRR